MDNNQATIAFTLIVAIAIIFGYIIFATHEANMAHINAEKLPLGDCQLYDATVIGSQLRVTFVCEVNKDGD